MSSDQDIIDTIAQILIDEFHRPAPELEPFVDSGLVLSELHEILQRRWRRMAQASLAALRSAGYAIVELPEPDDGCRVDSWLDARIHLDTTGEYVLQESGRITWHTPTEARQLAAALLAAADAAEADQ